MFLYVVFILLPATALAACEPDVYWALYNALDPDNNGQVGRSECDVMLNAFDADQNGTVTVAEVIAGAPYIAPEFVGHEQTVVTFVDRTDDGVITSRDIDIDFKEVDTDCNGLKSRAEFTSYVDTYCKGLEAKTT